VRVSPVTSTQRVVAGVWHELLGVPVDGFDVHDNFFALGGNSLQAIQLITRVRDALQITLNLRDIYGTDLGGLADLIDAESESIRGHVEAEVAELSEEELDRLLAMEAGEEFDLPAPPEAEGDDR
jgi:acyl carrier protein